MNKAKEIEEMAKELHYATNESFISCRKIARILVERRGYGNVKQAVKEFAEQLKEELWKLDGSWQEYDGEELCETVDNLITELYGADE